MQKKRITITVDLDLFTEIEKQAKVERRKVSELINEILKVIITSRKGYLTYELIRTKKAYEYAKEQAESHNNSIDTLQLIKKLKWKPSNENPKTLSDNTM